MGQPERMIWAFTPPARDERCRRAEIGMDMGAGAMFDLPFIPGTWSEGGGGNQQWGGGEIKPRQSGTSQLEQSVYIRVGCRLLYGRTWK